MCRINTLFTGALLKAFCGGLAFEAPLSPFEPSAVRRDIRCNIGIVSETQLLNHILREK